MSKSKTIYFPASGTRDGIDITYVKSRGVLEIGGWYDSFVGIETTAVPLGTFLRSLGISAKDCVKALENTDE